MLTGSVRSNLLLIFLKLRTQYNIHLYNDLLEAEITIQYADNMHYYYLRA